MAPEFLDENEASGEVPLPSIHSHGISLPELRHSAFKAGNSRTGTE
jgi:hypothetical protein